MENSKKFNIHEAVKHLPGHIMRLIAIGGLALSLVHPVQAENDPGEGPACSIGGVSSGEPGNREWKAKVTTWFPGMEWRGVNPDGITVTEITPATSGQFGPEQPLQPLSATVTDFIGRTAKCRGNIPNYSTFLPHISSATNN